MDTCDSYAQSNFITTYNTAICKACDLIDIELHTWKQKLIDDIFVPHKAMIKSIPLSRGLSMRYANMESHCEQ